MAFNVLVVGASGMLGGRISHHLLALPDVRVRLLMRGSSVKKDALQALVASGAELMDGDLADPGSLNRATAGIDVIVSAVQGAREVIVDGQVALAKAGEANGVRRMLPSDFALDLFKAPTGEHAMFNMRAEADRQIAATGLGQVNMLQGAFMDNFLGSKFGGVFDMAQGTASYWGHGHETFDATSVEDTARFTARAALDPNVPNGKFAIAGEQLSFCAIIDAVESVSGRSFARRSKGSIADLEATIAAQRAIDPGSMEALSNTYLLYMLSGKTALTDLQNGRYPDIVPERYLQHVARTWESVQ